MFWHSKCLVIIDWKCHWRLVVYLVPSGSSRPARAYLHVCLNSHTCLYCRGHGPEMVMMMMMLLLITLPFRSCYNVVNAMLFMHFVDCIDAPSGRKTINKIIIKCQFLSNSSHFYRSRTFQLIDGCRLKNCVATLSVASSGICHRNKIQLNCMTLSRA